MTVTILQGDCLERLIELPSGSFDAVIADPPYGTTQNAWDSIIPLEPLWTELWRVCRGPVVLTAMQPFSSVLVCSNIVRFKHEWIWEKNKGSGHLNAKKAPMRYHEVVLVFSMGAFTYNPQMSSGHKPGNVATNKVRSANYGAVSGLQEPYGGSTLRYPRSIQKFDVINNDSPERVHPTQKPVALFEYLIRTYTDEGDNVLDFSAGSGTTGIAAMNTGRNCTLIELNTDYVEIIKSRIAKAAPVSDLFG